MEASGAVRSRRATCHPHTSRGDTRKLLCQQAVCLWFPTAASEQDHRQVNGTALRENPLLSICIFQRFGVIDLITILGGLVHPKMKNYVIYISVCDLGLQRKIFCRISILFNDGNRSCQVLNMAKKHVKNGPFILYYLNVFLFLYILKCNLFLWEKAEFLSVTLRFRNHFKMLMWCVRNISYDYQSLKRLICLIRLWKSWYIFFRIQSSKEQHLFEIEILCNYIKFCIITFKASLLNKSINFVIFLRSYWPQTCERYCILQVWIHMCVCCNEWTDLGWIPLA